MGMVVGDFERINEDGDNELKDGALTIERMSTNVMAIMNALARNETIFKLLYFQDSNPMNHNIQNPVTPEDIKAKSVFINGDIKKLGSLNNKLSPLPFQPEAEQEDEVFIRVYYNQGNITSNEMVLNNQLHVDIICAKDLWLIQDNIRELGLIRPYSIMSRVLEEVGNKNRNNEIKVGNFVGFQHLSVNQQFECVRLYNNSMQLG